MTADQITAPAADVASAATDVPDVHLVCCKPNRGLCGEDLTGADNIPDTAEVTCSYCDLADEQGSPCGARFCRLRQWARQWFGWSR